MASVSTPEFWSDLYTRGHDGWELRQAAPPLVEFVERTPPAPGRVAVPGCGRGHDVRFLARRGHAVVGFDFSPVAVAEARTLARAEGVPAEFAERDIFTLGRDYERALVSEHEVRRLFASGFRVERAYQPHSVRPRQGQEWAVLFRRTSFPA